MKQGGRKLADGPVFTSFRYRQPVKYAVVEETIIIYNQIKKIDFEIDIKNWQGILYREFRAAFPLNMTAPKITYEVPMGVVEVGKDELKGAAGNMYTTECKLIHPRTLVDWVNASDDQFRCNIKLKCHCIRLSRSNSKSCSINTYSAYTYWHPGKAATGKEMTISSWAIIISPSRSIFMNQDGRTDSMMANRDRISSIQCLILFKDRTIPFLKKEFHLNQGRYVAAYCFQEKRG